MIVLAIHSLFGVFDLVENTLRDVRLASRGQLAPPAEVLIVDFPGWRSDMRGEVAEIISALSEGGAKTIVLDILLDEPWDEDGDAVLESAIEAAGNVVLAMNLGLEGGETKEMSVPLERFQKSSWGTGFANLISDPYDKVVREALIYKKGDELYFSLAALAAAHYKGVSNPAVIQTGAEGIIAHGVNIRGNHRGTRFIDFYGGKEVYDPETGASKVFTDELVRNMSALGLIGVDDSPFLGKIVIVGSTSAHTRDIHKTPFDAAAASDEPSMTPGIMIQANIIGNFLDDSLYIRDFRHLTAALTVVFALGFCILFISISQKLGFAVTASVSILLVVVQYYSFPAIAVSLIAPAAAVPLSYFAGLYFKYSEERRSKEKLRLIFGHYLSKNLAKTLLDNPSLIEMGGTEVECTFVICDIDSFSTLSERLQPVQVVEFLNFFFSEMHEAVKNYEGWLNKYLGDGMLVVFGALIRDGNHANRAVSAAVEMRYRLQRMQEFIKERFGFDSLGVTIGIHSGAACVGNIGAPDRMEYTVIGDAVNVCERIVGEGKKLGADIVISQETAALAPGAAKYEKAGVFAVKGRHQPVTLFRLE